MTHKAFDDPNIRTSSSP